jgi:hypothetical protein
MSVEVTKISNKSRYEVSWMQSSDPESSAVQLRLHRLWTVPEMLGHLVTAYQWHTSERRDILHRSVSPLPRTCRAVMSLTSRFLTLALGPNQLADERERELPESLHLTMNEIHKGNVSGVHAAVSTMLPAGRSRVRDPMRWMNLFSIYPTLPAALGPGVHSASNRNEYQKQNNIVSGE